MQIGQLGVTAIQPLSGAFPTAFSLHTLHVMCLLTCEVFLNALPPMVVALYEGIVHLTDLAHCLPIDGTYHVCMSVTHFYDTVLIT